MVTNRNKVKQTVQKRSEQLEYIQRTVLRTLWRNPKSWPFREPVDPVRHNASDYFDVIKHPMDFGTIRSKLLNNQYEDAEKCIADFRLVFENCYKYNADSLPIHEMCVSLEEIFNEKIRGIPSGTSIVEVTDDFKSDEDIPNVESPIQTVEEIEPVEVVEMPEVKPVKPKKASKKLAKESQKLPIKKKKSVEDFEQVYLANKAAELDLGVKRESRRNFFQSLAEFDGADCLPNSSPSIRYCYMIVKDLFTRKHSDYAWPYYEPVDVSAPSLSDYSSIVHYPADLSTIKTKLEKGMYGSAFECISEIRRMITNSFRYNPEGHAIHEMGKKLSYALECLVSNAPNELFDSLIFFTGASYSFPSSNTIQALEEQVQKVVAELTDLKSQRHKKKSKPKVSRKPVVQNDKEDYVNPITAKSQPSANAFLEVDHSEPMTYEEKRKLSMDINRLPPEKLGDVLGLICQLESNIVTDKNSSEVEIDFDHMKSCTLRKLEKFVKFLNKAPKQRRKRPLPKDGAKKCEESNGHVGYTELNSDADVVASLPISECSTPQDVSEVENIDFSLQKEGLDGKYDPTTEANLIKSATLDDSLIPESMLCLNRSQSNFKDVSKAVEEVKNQKKLQLEEAEEPDSAKVNDTSEIVHSPEEIELMKKEQQEKRLALASKTRAITAQSDLMAPYHADL